MELIYIILGIVAGYFSATLGVTAGTFIVPLLLMFGMGYATVVTTALVASLITAVAISGVFYKNKFRPMYEMNIPAAIAGLIGDIYLSPLIPPIILEFLYAGIMFWSVDLLNKVIDKLSADKDSTALIDSDKAFDEKDTTHHMFFMCSGIAAGLVASLLGMGPGLILIPLFVLKANFSYQYAIKVVAITSIVSMFFALSSEFYTHHVPYHSALIVSLGSIIGAFFGALTRKYLAPSLVAKVTFFVSFTLGLAMLFVILISSL
jgi:uncharacterized membrane protein YfcA